MHKHFDKFACFTHADCANQTLHCTRSLCWNQNIIFFVLWTKNDWNRCHESCQTLIYWPHILGSPFWIDHVWINATTQQQNQQDDCGSCWQCPSSVELFHNITARLNHHRINKKICSRISWEGFTKTLTGDDDPKPCVSSKLVCKSCITGQTDKLRLQEEFHWMSTVQTSYWYDVIHDSQTYHSLLQMPFENVRWIKTF